MSVLLDVSTARQKIETAYPFSVDKLPLMGPDNLRTPHYGLFRSDTGECLKYAPKAIYSPHTRDDIVTLTEAAMEGFGDIVDVDCGFREGHRIVVVPSNEHRRSIFGTTDNLFPRCIISGGYNGQSFRATLGAYYDRCLNLVMLSNTSEFSTSIRHNGKLRGRMADLVDKFRILASQWQRVGDVAAEMNTREASIASYIAEIYPLASDATDTVARKCRNRAEAIIKRILRERQATLGVLGNIERATMWELYMGVQGYVQHDMTRRNSPSNFVRAELAAREQPVQKALELSLAT